MKLASHVIHRLSLGGGGGGEGERGERERGREGVRGGVGERL